jgi:hypothetical protein
MAASTFGRTHGVHMHTVRAKPEANTGQEAIVTDAGDPKNVPDWLAKGTVRGVDERPEVQKLFANLKSSLPALTKLLAESGGHWAYEDTVYRFYHQSWKAYRAQERTQDIVKALQALASDRALNEEFMRTVSEGTGKTFQPAHNERWHEVTRPMLEAFFHARYFLEMAVRYGKELDSPPIMLPSGWAALPYLYQLR